MLESLVIQRFFVFNIKIVKEINPFRPVDKKTCPNEWAGRYDFLVHYGNQSGFFSKIFI